MTNQHFDSIKSGLSAGIENWVLPIVIYMIDSTAILNQELSKLGIAFSASIIKSSLT